MLSIEFTGKLKEIHASSYLSGEVSDTNVPLDVIADEIVQSAIQLIEEKNKIVFIKEMGLAKERY